MPVYKRAARPGAAPPSEPRSVSRAPREPLLSDNDFTVLFQRESAPARRALPYVAPAEVVPPARPAAFPRLSRPVTRQVSPPMPAPKPPSNRSLRERPESSWRAAADGIETVAIAPGPRERILRVAFLLSLGCLVGVAVERFVRAEVVADVASRAEPVEVSTTQLTATSGPVDEPALPAPAATVANATEGMEKDAAAPVVHHHHTHHAAPAAASAVSAGEDASGGADDVAAAMQALSKAKEEVTLP